MPKVKSRVMAALEQRLASNVTKKKPRPTLRKPQVHRRGNGNLGRADG